MYDLHLTPEQIEFRDAIRDFINSEVKPAAIDPRRLEPFEKPLMTGFLDQLAQMGLRGLGLPEAAGGAGADLLTGCVLLEEIAVGDVDLAMVLGETALLAPALHDAMNDGQRQRWLSKSSIMAKPPRFRYSRKLRISLSVSCISPTSLK